MRRWEECQQKEREMFTEACVDEQILFREAKTIPPSPPPPYISELLILDANHSFWNVEISLICLK